MLLILTEKFINKIFVRVINMVNERGAKLADNVKRFLNSANLVYSSEDYTSATILYFKALFSTFDWIILRKFGRIPKDHTDRFQILKQNYSEFYVFLDKYFPKYRESYTMSISKEDCDKIKEYAERIIAEQGIF